MGKKFIDIYNRIGNEPYNEKNEIKSNKEKQINKETRIDKTWKYYYNLAKNIMIDGNIQRVIKMIKTIGKVIEVFIPQQYRNDVLLDVMDRTNIGFKVITNNGIRKIIVESNEFNAKIMKNDIVIIIEQTIFGKNFIDIEQYEGDKND